MLDTDTVSFALRGEGKVAERIQTRLPSEILVSSLTAAELWFGVERRQSKKLRRLVATFLDTVEVLPFDAAAAQRYGRVAAALVAKGQPIGLVDAMIAAHAITSESVLVTHNAAHFRRVSGIDLEDWY
ncbi:MAG: type II toxin-antitoxin system VapC family toxin [Planctomycetota bacterium]